MRCITVLVLGLGLTILSATPRAQEALTREQRIADLTQLASSTPRTTARTSGNATRWASI